MAEQTENLEAKIEEFLGVFGLDPETKSKVVENISKLNTAEKHKVLKVIVSKMAELKGAQKDFLNRLLRSQKRKIEDWERQEHEKDEQKAEKELNSYFAA